MILASCLILLFIECRYCYDVVGYLSIRVPKLHNISC